MKYHATKIKPYGIIEKRIINNLLLIKFMCLKIYSNFMKTLLQYAEIEKINKFYFKMLNKKDIILKKDTFIKYSIKIPDKMFHSKS